TQTDLGIDVSSGGIELSTVVDSAGDMAEVTEMSSSGASTDYPNTLVDEGDVDIDLELSDPNVAETVDIELLGTGDFQEEIDELDRIALPDPNEDLLSAEEL